MPRGASRDRSSRPHRPQHHRRRRDRGVPDLGRALAEARVRRGRSPRTCTPFLTDEDLESRRLERVQGWALLFAAVVAVALPLYWLHEPSRQKESANYFDKNAVDRGQRAVLRPDDGLVQLRACRCSARTATAPRARAAVPNFTLPNGKSVVWKAPPLNTVLLRFTEDPKCVDPDLRPTLQCSVTDIITYGRPGTPMPAWGVIGGGAKNDQSIQDLIAFLRTIQLTPEEAQKQAADRPRRRAQAAAGGDRERPEAARGRHQAARHGTHRRREGAAADRRAPTRR